MSNIATLGLEFNAKGATDRIKKLCDSFDELSKKSSSVQEVFKVLSDFKPINNTFVTQLAAVSDSFSKFKGIDGSIGAKITSITNALSNIQPVSGAAATSLANFASGLKNIKLDTDTNQSLQSISTLMRSLHPVSPDVSTSLHNLVASVNAIQPVSPSVTQSLQSLNGVLQAMSASTGLQDLSEVQKSLNNFTGIKPEVAVSIKELFNTFKEVKSVDSGAIDSVAKLGDATARFKAVRPNIVTSVEQLFSAIGSKLPSIDASKTDAISHLGEATAKFKAIKPNIATSIEQLFQTIANIKNIPYNITDNVNKLGEGLRKFKAIKPEVVQSVKNLFDTLSALKPVSANLRISIQMLTDMFNAMAAAGRNASGATKTLGQSMGFAQTQTDGLSIAFRTLQGAVSLNFFKSATAQAVEFGTELAQLKSIASELNTSQIGKGVMNFSSVLGNPRENLEALYYAYSSGIRGTEDDFLKFTDIVKKTAVVNRASVIPMADAMTAAMNAYGLSVDHAGEVADTFYSIVKYGKASGEQLANSFGQVSPTAKTLGVSLDELGAAIASLTKIQPTRVAITGLNNMLSKIMKPTKESRLALQRLGVDMSYSAVQSKGFVNVLKEVREALNGNMEEIKNIFPDIRGQRAAMQLLGAGWEDFSAQLDNFANKKGAMQGAFDIFAKDTAVQIGAIPETIKKIVTEAGKMVTEIVTLGGALTPVIAAFNNMSEGARKFFAAITLVVGGYTAYKAAMFALQSLHAIQLKNEAAIAAAQTAKLAQLQAEVVLRKQLAGLSVTEAFSADNTIKGVGRTGLGFNKGFAAMFDIKNFTKSFNRSIFSLAHPIKSITAQFRLMGKVLSGTFAKALTYAGAILGKVVTIITTVFTAANMIIAGVVAIAAVGLDYAINGVENSVTARAIEGIYNWWTGAGEAAKSLDEHIKRTYENLAKIEEHKLTFAIGDEEVLKLKDQLFPKAEQKQAEEYKNNISQMVQNYSTAQKKYKTIVAQQEELNKTVFKYDQELQKTIKNSKTTWSDWGELIGYITLGTVGGTLATIATLPLGGFIGGVAVASVGMAAMTAKADQMIKSAEAQKTAQEKLNKAQEELAKVENKATEDKEKYTKALETLKRELPKQINFFRQQLENVKEVQSIFAQQTLDDKWDGNELGYAAVQFSDNITKFKRAIGGSDTKAMSDVLKNAQKNYKKIRDTATQIGKDMAELQIEGMLLGAKSDSTKKAIYDKQSNKAFTEMQNALASGNLNAASKALKSYMKNAQNSIGIQNKLATAEKQANNNTLQMVLALNKFKTTAMDFIDINSTEAMKLQSRAFGTLPSFLPLTAQQDSVQAANDKLAEAINKYSQIIINKSNQEKTSAENQWLSLEQKYNQKIYTLEDQLNGLLRTTAFQLETLVANENKAAQEDQKAKTAQNGAMEAMKNTTNQILAKLKQGIEITNLKGQKVVG